MLSLRRENSKASPSTLTTRFINLTKAFCSRPDQDFAVLISEQTNKVPALFIS